MSSTLATMILAAGMMAQHPTGGSPAAPALSAEEVARLESPHLTNIRQVTSGFSRAGRGVFQSGRPCDHFSGGPVSGSVDLSSPQARRGWISDL